LFAIKVHLTTSLTSLKNKYILLEVYDTKAKANVSTLTLSHESKLIKNGVRQSGL
jgi:hypothetical protein